jgi:hypothetical protein
MLRHLTAIADVDFLNPEAGDFLDLVTDRGKKLE